MLMIDPKRVELSDVQRHPAPQERGHHRSVAWRPARSSMITREMDQRYERFASARACARSKSTTPSIPADDPLPYIVVVIDELADLMLDRAGAKSRC